jgi:hypothetical protein
VLDEFGRNLTEGGTVPQLNISLSAVEVVSRPAPALRVIRSSDRPAGWADIVAEAQEPCLLLDAGGTVQAVSEAFVSLFGIADPARVIGRGLLDDVVDLVGFSSVMSRLSGPEVDRIPPLQALRSGSLARGLLRARVAGRVCTVDAITTPLRVDGAVTGSLTFFASI